MDNLNFYDVPTNYVNYLREFETNVRGTSLVPYANYEDTGRHRKFFCGIVLRINDYQYYVPVSSKTTPHRHTFYLSNGRQFIGSLRFDYMFPVPAQIIAKREIANETDLRYGDLLKQELTVCRQNQFMIHEYALRTYTEVVAVQDEQMRSHSCAFRILEGACEQYCREHGLSLDPQQTAAAPAADTRSLAELCADAKTKAAAANARQTPARELPAPEHDKER